MFIRQEFLSDTENSWQQFQDRSWLEAVSLFFILEAGTGELTLLSHMDTVEHIVQNLFTSWFKAAPK